MCRHSAVFFFSQHPSIYRSPLRPKSSLDWALTTREKRKKVVLFYLGLSQPVFSCITPPPKTILSQVLSTITIPYASPALVCAIQGYRGGRCLARTELLGERGRGGRGRELGGGAGFGGKVAAVADHRAAPRGAGG